MQTIVFLILAWFLILQNHRSFLKLVGFKPITFSAIIKYFILGFSFYLIISHYILTIQNRFNITIPGFGTQSSHINIFGNNFLGWLSLGIITIIIAPITEEIIYRGILQQSLYKFGPKTAVFISALIFAMIHLEFQVIGPLFLLGAILGYIFYQSKSLYTTIIFHAIVNTLAFIAEFTITQ